MVSGPGAADRIHRHRDCALPHPRIHGRLRDLHATHRKCASLKRCLNQTLYVVAWHDTSPVNANDADNQAGCAQRQTFTYAVMATALREAATRHGWLRTTHEHLCVDSVVRFRELATRLGLEWGDEAARFVEASDREGSGYRTERRTADQPERWRHRLTDEQVERILATLERFPTLERPAV